MFVCMAFIANAAPLHIQSVDRAERSPDFSNKPVCNKDAKEAMSCKHVHTFRMRRPSSRAMAHSEPSDMVTPRSGKWVRLMASAKFTKRAAATL